MSTFIRTINKADNLVRMFRLNCFPAEVLEEYLLDLSFFDIEIVGWSVTAKLNNVKWSLGHEY